MMEPDGLNWLIKEAGRETPAEANSRVCAPWQHSQVQWTASDGEFVPGMAVSVQLHAFGHGLTDIYGHTNASLVTFCQILTWIVV